MLRAIFLSLLVPCLLSAAQAQACDSKDSILEATTNALEVRMEEYTYDEAKSNYEVRRTIAFKQPLPAQYRKIAADYREVDKVKKKAVVCLNTPTSGRTCDITSAAPPRIWNIGTCFDLYRPGMYKARIENKETSRNQGCDFDGMTKTTVIEKVDSAKNLVNISYTEDREVTECGKPAQRFVRTDYIVYKVIDGCLLHAKAQGCDLGPVGSNPCKACKSGQVRAWFTADKTSCVKPTFTCDMDSLGFRGCPQGHEAVKVDGSTLTCSVCKPHTFNSAYPDEQGRAIRVTCTPCPDYSEAPLWASEDCSSCPPGHVPTSKRPPLNCKKCPAGSYAYQTDTKCTRCAGGFYQDKAGASECLKCPTEWRCLVPTKILGKFGTTPYRWDESGNPACASLDGKTCWKTEPASCAEKLKMLPKLISENKLKSLICGPYHKKVWGYDGYGDYGGWCQITRNILLQPGKPDVGATGCTANATMVGALPQVLQAEKKEETCKPCQCPGSPAKSDG